MVNRKPTQFNWRDLLEESENIQADVYVLYLRRSRKQKKKRTSQDNELEEKRSNVDNISIEQQREACKYIAEIRELKIIKTFEEEEPAKDPNKRPEFNKMLSYLKETDLKTGVLAWAPDRLSRNALESGVLIQAFLDKQIIDFQFATYFFKQDESGLEYLMMEFARAMGYSLRLRKNVLRGMHKGYFDNSEWQFPNKFGYTRLLKTLPSGKKDFVNFLIPYEETKEDLMSEFETVKLAYKLRQKGWSFEDIATEINRIGYFTKNKRRGKMTKKRLGGDKYNIGILKDSFFYGLATSKFGEMDLTENTEFDDEGNLLEFVPAITKEEFDLCQTINTKKANIKAQTHDYIPLRGIIKCGHCGNLLTPQIKKEKYVFYYCYNEFCEGKKLKNGKMPAISGTNLFPQIQDILKKGLKVSKTEFTRYLVALERQQHLKKHLVKTDLKRINANKGHIQKQIDDKVKEFTKALSNLSNPTKSAKLMEISHNKEIAKLEERLNDEEQKEKKLKRSNYAWTQKLSEWLEHMQKAYYYWDKATLEQKMVIAQKIFLELTIENDKLASYKYNEPFETSEIINLSHTGRGDRTRTCDLTHPMRTR